MYPAKIKLVSMPEWDLNHILAFSASTLHKDFRHEVNLLVKLRHLNIFQFLCAVTDKKPLMLDTEYLRGGDLQQHLQGKGALSPSTAISFALDIARGMAYLHNLKPSLVGGLMHGENRVELLLISKCFSRNGLLVNSSANHLKVGYFGLSKLIRVKHSHDVYKMSGETGSYRYMAPEVFKNRTYDKKPMFSSFRMILI
ncbi:hypothetical protein SASPL_133212 [Salvia splendens]|uniref:Protein kinase domain-containing protein n=1 Tax=Salvia splendens TaxID=180675 RepID=A0A8X8X4G8_SALSN|nr:hypothetical protein SASPL_133212 [Salvia splendens]